MPHLKIYFTIREYCMGVGLNRCLITWVLDKPGVGLDRFPCTQTQTCEGEGQLSPVEWSVGQSPEGAALYPGNAYLQHHNPIKMTSS